MKKIFLSFFTIVLFLAYGFFQRNNTRPIVSVTPVTPSPSTKNTEEDDFSSGNPPSPTPSQIPSQTQVPSQKGVYRDGSYTGSVADAFYGNVQVKATIQNGKIIDVSFLQYPNDRQRSMMISMMSMPTLKQEALSVQNSQVDIVSGATDTSQAFIESLGSALAQARQ